MAKKAFGLHLVSYLAVLVSLFTDGIYPTRNLDAALQEVFGSDEHILDCSSVTAMGDCVVDAKDKAYQGVEKIDFDQAYCRSDIADKAIARIKN